MLLPNTIARIILATSKPTKGTTHTAKADTMGTDCTIENHSVPMAYVKMRDAKADSHSKGSDFLIVLPTIIATKMYDHIKPPVGPKSTGRPLPKPANTGSPAAPRRM